MAKFNIKQVAFKAVGLGVGAVGAEMLSRYVPVGGQYQGVVKIAAGALLPGLLSKRKNQMIEYVGDGMIAAGARELVDTFLPSVGALPVSMYSVNNSIGMNPWDESY